MPSGVGGNAHRRRTTTNLGWVAMLQLSLGTPCVALSQLLVEVAVAEAGLQVMIYPSFCLLWGH